MERVSVTLTSLVNKYKTLAKDSPERKLKKHLTKNEFQHIKFCYIKRRVMTINVDSSVWLYALSLRKQDLSKKLGVQDIVFRLGDIR